MTKIVAMLSAKGGVGKTVCTTNLAIALAKRNQEITVVDGNLTTPNVSLHLGIPFYPVTLHDVIKRKAEIDETVYKHPSGINVVPASLSLADLKYYRPKKFKKAVRKLLDKRGLIFIDGAAGLGREARASMDLADEILVITNPNLPAVTDALKLIKLAESRRKNVLGVILNKHKGKKYEMSIKEIKDMLDVPLLGVIPHDEKVDEAISAKEPIVRYAPRSKSAVEFNRLAANLVGEEFEEPLHNRGFWTSLFSWFRR